MSIIKSIDKFMNHRMYQYALLINGKWGSGKTYFVKEILTPYIKSLERDVNYISLYGINSTDEISQILCVQAIKDKTPEFVQKKLNSKSGQLATKLISTVFKGGMNLIGLGETGIQSILNYLPNFDDNVIIFDDLERCGCPINEVLGYINNFVEHSKASVILVANEEEIGKSQLNQHTELQTLIAMDPIVSIELPPSKIEFFTNRIDNQKPKTSFSPEEIEERRRILFHRNDGYETIKEKVIGLTINYEPDLKPIFSNLIEANIKADNLKECLLSELEWLVSTAEKDGHKNLRTFQYFLEKISMIFEVTNDKFPTLRQMLIRYTYRSSIRYMKGQKMPKWDADVDYGMQVFGEEQVFHFDQEFGFRFIDDLIEKNIIDSTYVNSILTNFSRLSEKKGQLSDDPSQLIKNWYISEDSQISEWLSTIENNVIKGVYSTELYTELLQYIAILESHHIEPEKCHSLFVAMKKYIKAENPAQLDNLGREHFIFDEKTGVFFKSMFSEISELIEVKKKCSEKQKYLNAIIDLDHWATNLVNASKNNGNLQGHSFVYWLEPDQLLCRIKESNNLELDQFRQALICVYGTRVYYEYQKDDYEHLKNLLDGMQQLDISNWGQVKKIYQEWIINDLKQYIEKIRPEEKR